MPKRIRAFRDSTRQLMAWAEAHGWTPSITKGNHFMFSHPKCAERVAASYTPTDKNGWYLSRAKMRRAMLAAGFSKKEVK